MTENLVRWTCDRTGKGCGWRPHPAHDVAAPGQTPKDWLVTDSGEHLCPVCADGYDREQLCAALGIEVSLGNFGGPSIDIAKALAAARELRRKADAFDRITGALASAVTP
jgi:hypothetical protein